MTIFSRLRVNKEWLSMHQCIDDNCPVHSFSKVKPITGGSVTCHNNILEKSFSNTYVQNCTDNKFNEQHEINDNCTVKTLANITTETLKDTTEDSYEEAETYASNVGLRTLTQRNEDHLNEASLTNKEISDIDKPNFMCTWLKNNVDINNFPFYKKAVYYANLRTVRNEFSVYSTSVTNHIWTSKNGADAAKRTGYISNGKDNTLVKEGKASKSHENIFENIGTVLKDSPDTDISDLKLKYAFLFNPRFRTINMAHAEGETYPYGIEIGNIWTPHSYSRSNRETMNIENESNECIKNFPYELSTRNTTNNDSVQSLVCSDPNNVDFKLHPQHTQLLINSQTLVFQESKQESSLQQYNSTAIDKTVQKLAANCDNKYWRRDSGAAYTYGKTEYDSHSSNDSFSYADNNVQNSFNATHIQYSESPNNLYSPASDPLDKFAKQNVLPQTPIGSSRNTSPANSYLKVSPLVSSPVFSHYISPSQQLHSPAYAGQTYHFYTKRNRDPRLESRNSESTPDRLLDRRMHYLHNLHTPILHSFSVSPGSEKGPDINHGPPIQTSGHRAHGRRSTCTERQTRKRREDQSLATWEDEDPLGLSNHRNTERQLSTGKYIKSRDSEAFYSTDKSKNDEELNKLDGRMDNYQKLVGSYSSPLAASYRSYPARYSPYYVERSRYCMSQHARYSRDRSRSREKSVSNSRSSTSHRCRRSKSPPTVRHLKLSSESSCDHRQSGKSIHDRFNRRSVFIAGGKSSNSHCYSKNNYGKNKCREISRDPARYDKNYRRENEHNRKRSSETKTASEYINKSYGSLEYKKPRLSNNNDRKKRPLSQRRYDISHRLEGRSNR